MPLTLFSMWELRSITIAELKYLYALVYTIWYSPVADIVDYFKVIHTLVGPILSAHLYMVTRITLNLGCPEMSLVSYIQGMYQPWALTICARAHLARRARLLYFHVV
jgi:hypothetical protein